MESEGEKMRGNGEKEDEDRERERKWSETIQRRRNLQMKLLLFSENNKKVSHSVIQISPDQHRHRR